MFAHYNIFLPVHICSHHKEVVSGCTVLNSNSKANSILNGAPMYAILFVHMMVLTGLIRQPVYSNTKKILQMEHVDTDDFAHLKADALSKS